LRAALRAFEKKRRAKANRSIDNESLRPDGDVTIRLGPPAAQSAANDNPPFRDQRIAAMVTGGRMVW
jgi:hypothetical protein